MIILNEEKWEDIKNDFIKTIDYTFSEAPLMYFDHKKNREEEIGTRETYEFTKNETDYMIVVDIENRGSGENSMYKLSVKFRDKDGSWKDSSALESNFEQE
jgi:hypothetical protein